METVPYKIPAHFIPYLVNSDPSNLSDEEITQIDAFVESEKKRIGTSLFFCVSLSDETEFSIANDVNNLASEIYRCEFQIDSY